MVHRQKRILFLLCTLLLASTCALAQPAPWKRYTIRGEEFSVMLPAPPATSSRKPVVMRLGKAQQQRTLGAYADGLAFTVLCVENVGPRESLDDYLEQEIFTHAGWERTSQQELTVNGFKGKQYISPNKVPGTMQIFATRNHICRFHAFGATTEDARIKQFFSSIVLGGKPQGILVSEVAATQSQASTATQDNANAFTVKNVERRPFIAMKPEPRYTEEARRNATVGSVILKAIFTADGTITNIQVASGLPHGLTEKALEAVQKIRFIPAMKNGKFVSTWMQLEYNFNLY
jgi:TonB family protein